MECLLDCGWKHKPESLNLLVNHVEACSICIPKDVKVIWKDSEFFIVEETTEEDTVIDVTFRKFAVPPIVDAIDVRQPIDSLGFIETVPVVEAVEVVASVEPTEE